MSKRIIAILLCVVMLVPCLAACAKKDDEKEDPGAYITMYLTDDIYDFDPANAYYNADAVNVVSLMFETLFTLNDDGKVKKSLVDDYDFFVDKRTGEHYMELTLKETYWSNGTQLSADDVAFAWRRLLTSTNDFAAASLLYDIKNARAIKEGDVSIDNVGIEAVSVDTLKVTFEGEIDYDQFILNLTSVATAPLMESYVTKNPDWAKKPSTMVTSGPYKLGKINYSTIVDENESEVKIRDDYSTQPDGSVLAGKSYLAKKINFFYLERNVYYFRDLKRDAINESVTNYRILVDCSKTAEQILADYQAGKLFYVGNIPLSLRKDAYVQEQVEVSNALSTFVLYMNEYAIVNDGANGSMLFSDANVRKALSLAIDRNAIATEVVYAQAATGLVCPGVFEGGKIKKNNDFRAVGGDILAASANVAEAKSLLSTAGIDASQYSFSIKVAAYDDVNVKIAEMVAAAWTGLGFNVTVDEMLPIENNDYYKEVEDFPKDVCEDRFIEALQCNDYEVIAFDYNAFTVDAYSMLSNFSLPFSGMGLNIATYNGNTSYLAEKNTTGYLNMDYNNLMEAIYYLPYVADLESATSDYIKSVQTQKPYVETATLLAQSALAYANSAKEATAYAAENAELEAEYEAIVASLSSIPTLLQYAEVELVRSFGISAQTFAKETDVANALNSARNAINNATVSVDDYLKVKKASSNNLKDPLVISAGAAATNALLDVVTVVGTTAETIIAAATEAETAAASADGRTLYEIITAIYSENGITPSKKSSDWTKQKAILLHKAETILLNDMPVIPVLFNQNAIMVSDQLTKVTSNYYIPAYFRKTNLKKYTDYTYVDDKGETVSIFADFPLILWDKIGK